MISDAEQNGYLTGKVDLSLSRWDGDNAMPPVQFVQHSGDWFRGYNRAYEEKMSGNRFR